AASVPAADVEKTGGTDPRRKVLADSATMQSRPRSRAEVYGGVEMAVVERGRQGPTHCGAGLTQHARHLGVTRVGRIVVGVGAVHLRIAHARVLMEQPASTTARERKRARHAERDVA